VHTFNSSRNILKLKVGISSRAEQANIFDPILLNVANEADEYRQSKNRAPDGRLGIGDRRISSVNGGHSVQ